MGQQRIDQRFVRAARRRMHHHAGRFIDDDKVVIFINHIQRNILRLDAAIDRRRQGEADRIIAFDPIRRVFYGLLVLRAGQPTLAVLNQALQPRARQGLPVLCSGFCQQLIKAGAVMRVADEKR